MTMVKEYDSRSKDQTIDSRWIKSFNSKSIKFVAKSSMGGGVREKAKLLLYWPPSPPKKWYLYDGYKAINFMIFGKSIRMHQNDDLRKLGRQFGKMKSRRVLNEPDLNIIYCI